MDRVEELEVKCQALKDELSAKTEGLKTAPHMRLGAGIASRDIASVGNENLENPPERSNWEEEFKKKTAENLNLLEEANGLKAALEESQSAIQENDRLIDSNKRLQDDVDRLQKELTRAEKHAVSAAAARASRELPSLPSGEDPGSKDANEDRVHDLEMQVEQLYEDNQET